MAGRSTRHGTDDLTTLAAEFGRVTGRARQQKVAIKRDVGAGSAAWQRWSASIDEALILAERIDACPVSDLEGLVVRFRALLWRIRSDEAVILDSAFSAALERFGRALERLTRQAGQSSPT